MKIILSNQCSKYLEEVFVRVLDVENAYNPGTALVLFLQDDSVDTLVISDTSAYVVANYLCLSRINLKFEKTNG